MKWTIVFLAAGGILVYGIIFAIQVNHQSPVTGGPVSVDGGLRAPAIPAMEVVQESDLNASAPSILDAEPTVLLQTPAEVEEVSIDSRIREWEGGAWAAGCRAYEARDLETARLALEDAVSEREDIAYRHYLLGLTYLKLDEPDLAVTELERSAELAPEHLKTLVHLGRAYLEIDDSVTAREVIDSALDIDLNNGDSWHVLGRIELNESKLDEADAAFRKAVENDSEHAWAWNNLGFTRIQAGRYGEAVEPLRSATALRDDVSAFYNNLGVALERSGDPVAALVAFDEADALGHDTAGVSRDRVEAVLLARGASTPEADVVAVAPFDSLAIAGR